MRYRQFAFLVLTVALVAFCGQCPGPGPDPPETVTVEVCLETLKLANEWCPFHGPREYVKGQEPTTVCTVHKKPEDPDPTPVIRVYVGVYDLLGATGDWRAFLKTVKDNGGFGLRLFVCFSWQAPQTGGSPYKQVGTWTHDNGITFPLYRLAEWNPAFWTHLRDVLDEMKSFGLEAWLVVEDYCSLKGDSRSKYWSPMYSSEEALGPDTPGGVWGESMKNWHALLMGKTIQTADAAGVKYLIEPQNEMNIVDGTEAEAVAWHAWAVGVIKANGVPVERIIGTSEVAPAQIAAQVGYYSPHGIGRPDQIVATWNGIPAAKLIYSSDGYWSGGPPGDCDAKGRCGVNETTAPGIRDKIKSVGAYGYEWLPRGCYAANNDRADVGLFNGAILRALAIGD